MSPSPSVSNTSHVVSRAWSLWGYLSWDGLPNVVPTLTQCVNVDELVCDEECWTDDGRIVLIATSRGFKVCKGILVAQSPVFRDMFASSIPENEAIENCRVVHVSDSAEDLRHFLGAILSVSEPMYVLKTSGLAHSLTGNLLPPVVPRRMRSQDPYRRHFRNRAPRTQVSGRQVTVPGAFMHPGVLHNTLRRMGEQRTPGQCTIRKVLRSSLRDRCRKRGAPDGHPLHSTLGVLRLLPAWRESARGGGDTEAALWSAWTMRTCADVWTVLVN